MSNGSSQAKDDGEETEAYGATLMKPFLGPPVFQIFQEVYSKTQFYETRTDAFHPIMKDRVVKMKEVSDARSKEVQATLNEYFKNKINNLIKLEAHGKK